MELIKKRQRGVNWAPDMKAVLVELVKPFIAIIDSKIGNAKMIKQKNDCWKKIKTDMDTAGYTFSCWSRAKTTARSSISAYKKGQRQTGGGTPPKTPDELEFQISGIAAMDFEVDLSAYDCDAINSASKSNVKRWIL